MKFLLIIGLLVCSWYAGAQVAPSIAEFEVTLAPSQSLPLGQKISLNISTSKIEELNNTLAEYNHIKTSVVDDKTLNVIMNKRPQYKTDIRLNPRQYLADTFVIDFSEQSTKGFIEEFRLAANSFLMAKPSSTSLAEFEAYVAQYIDKPSYVNGFNIASVVASERSGDCTEYAVLLTALIRAHDIPARVILGTVIIDDGTRLRSVGHAWVEAWQKDQWHILDSALYSLIGTRNYYLPAQALTNEGLGFRMSVLQSVSLIPQKIDMVKSVN